MHGEIRIGKWRPFHASQILAPAGFVWAATAGGFPMKVSGFDRYTDGEGEMSWRLLSMIPVMRAAGPDTTRSAAGRCAGEMVAFTPASALSGHWEALDADRVSVNVEIDTQVHPITLEVAPSGALRSVSFPRWGDPAGSFGEHVFGVETEGEITADGYTLPASLRAGWWYGTDRWSEGEFFRATIDDVEFF